MAQTQIGLGYSTATGRLRWIMVPDDDAQLAKAATPGISVLMISNAQYAAAAGHTALQARINTARGSAPVNDRVIFLDVIGRVVSWGYFDAACGDVVPPGLTHVFNNWRGTDWPDAAVTRRSSLLGSPAVTVLRPPETEPIDIARFDR